MHRGWTARVALGLLFFFLFVVVFFGGGLCVRVCCLIHDMTFIQQTVYFCSNNIFESFLKVSEAVSHFSVFHFDGQEGRSKLKLMTDPLKQLCYSHACMLQSSFYS